MLRPHFNTFAICMKHLFLTLLLYFLFPVFGFTQVDSLSGLNDRVPKDSLIVSGDSLLKADSITSNDSLLLFSDSIRLADSIRIADSLKRIELVTVKKSDQLKDGIEKIFIGKEALFYFLLFLLLLFGSLRRAFPKYFADLFRVFFKTTLKQRQTQEQLLQSPLPSVFMNGYFVLTTGLYINFLLQHFGLSVVENFWLQYLYCAGALATIYIVKFIGLKLTGWLFNVGDATDSYIFIVFIINKMMGIFLLPLLIFMAFSGESLFDFTLYISWIGIALLLFYRFILSYGAVRKEVKLNSFHFLLYIFGFELIPLLLIYKLLLVIF